MKQPTVALVTMPWDLLAVPSIRLGILKSALMHSGVDTITCYFNLAFAEFLDERAKSSPDGRLFGVAEYEEIANRFHLAGLGDWVFSAPPFRECTAESDAQYLSYLRRWHASDAVIERALWVRTLVPDFIDLCARRLLASSPGLIGFTTTFSQNVASLSVAKLIKERSPDTAIVFGGANCEGPMGVALHKAFPWIDVVVRGEGDNVLVKLAQQILSSRPISPEPGLCYRDGKQQHVVPEARGGSVAMDDVQVPDYDDYFSALSNSPLMPALWNRTRIPFESSRGCWWGEKHHCTFCGLNGATMAFRSKSPEKVAGELMTLSRRYRRLDFEAVDNIVDMDYFHTLLPILKSKRCDYRIFYEIKANLTRSQLRQLRDAGVRSIQPGIESLDSRILALMRKGVTALQNLRLLKWCSELGILVSWSIIYGFPDEPVSAYMEMASLVPALTHLTPPYLSGLVIDRFSPYHQHPDDHGIKLLGPRPDYALTYPVSADILEDLAYKFDYRLKDGRDPESYVQPLRNAIELWQQDHDGKTCGNLQYRRGDGFILIEDRRCLVEAADHVLAEPASAIFLECDCGATPATVQRKLHSRFPQLTLASVETTLAQLCEMRLVFEERGRFLSLAVAADAEDYGEEDAVATAVGAESAALTQIG